MTINLMAKFYFKRDAIGRCVACTDNGFRCLFRCLI